MPWLRRRLSWALAGWFLCQLAGVATPLLFAANVAVEEVCVCPDAEEGAACPMHHAPGKGGQKADSPDADGVLTNACSPTDTALLSLVMGNGILPASVAVVTAGPVAPLAIMALADPSSIVLSSDGPPPRA